MSSSSGNRKFFGHPFQLSYLFHIELWERFSYYGMQGILLIYLYYQAVQGGLGFDKAQAGAIVGAYSGSVYLSTIIGGWIADRVLGAERTLFYSGIVVMCGHIALGIVPGVGGLLCGLVLVALGSGGVKSSASAMVGSLYESGETRHLRDAGFSIFYIAINIGGFLGPLMTGLLQENLGFHYGFSAAAVGMAFGLWRYSLGRKYIPRQPAPRPLRAGEGKMVLIGATAAAAALAAAFATEFVHAGNFPKALLHLVITITVIYFMRMFAAAGSDIGKRRNLTAYAVLFVVICIFWALWFQIYTAVTVYFDEIINRKIGNFVIPVSWKDALSSLWVILFAGVMAALWTKMGSKQPKTPLKFALSMLILGASYWAFVPFLSGNTVMPLAVFALLLIGIVIAELLISPIALSLATKLAPEGFQTQMVALGFLALSIGMTEGGALFKTYYAAGQPETFYMLIGNIGVISGAVLLIMVPLLNRLLRGAD